MKSFRIMIMCTALIFIIIVIAVSLSVIKNTSVETRIVQKESSFIDWPVFGGNQGLDRCFYNDKFDFAILDSQPILKWSWKCPQGISAPVQSNGIVALGCGDGTLRFLSLETGKLLNQIKLGDTSVEAPPLILNGMTYAGDTEGGFYCADMKNFTLKWKSKLGNKIRGGANWYASESGTKLFFGAYDSRLYCMDAATGKELYSIETAGFVNGAPAVSQESKMVSACDCGGRLTVLNAETLKPIRNFEFGSYMPASPALKDDAIIFSAHDGILHGIDIRKMEELEFADQTVSKETEKEPLMQSPALSAKYIVSCGSKGTVKVFSRPDVKLLSEKKFKGKLTSPLILGDNVLIAGEDGILSLLTLPGLTEKWTLKTPYEYMDGAVFFGSGFLICDLDGNVFCYSFKPVTERSK